VLQSVKHIKLALHIKVKCQKLFLEKRARPGILNHRMSIHSPALPCFQMVLLKRPRITVETLMRVLTDHGVIQMMDTRVRNDVALPYAQV
jgi:hypothetical protein